jgi:hypothetical protein
MDTKVLAVAEAPLVDADQIPERFQALCQLLPVDDGVRRFCQVHEVMSREVNKHLANHAGFKDPEGLERMDIHLVARFFDNVARWEREPDSVGKAWSPLFERRADKTIAPILFAIAGIHSHVASDLVWAILETHAERGTDPELGSELHDDYVYVNDIEGRLRDGVEEALGSEAFEKMDERLGSIDDKVRSWSFARARDKAWLDAMVEAKLPKFLANAHREVLDRATGLTNRMIVLH